MQETHYSLKMLDSFQNKAFIESQNAYSKLLDYQNLASPERNITDKTLDSMGRL